MKKAGPQNNFSDPTFLVIPHNQGGVHFYKITKSDYFRQNFCGIDPSHRKGIYAQGFFCFFE